MLFVDDAAMMLHHNTFRSLEKLFNRELRKIHLWFIANKLTLNLQKTKYMLFYRCREQNHMKKFRVNINCINIKRVEHFKYLGVIMDHKLNWDKHIEYLCSKLAEAWMCSKKSASRSLLISFFMVLIIVTKFSR